MTNLWGRPLEFRLSTAVQPNRVQQILYAATLAEYVCGELVTEVVGWLLAGLAIAKIVRPPFVAITPVH